MNDKIKSVTNERVEIEEKKSPNGKKEVNKITVEFLNAGKKDWRIRVETATLKNCIDEETGDKIFLDPVPKDLHIGLTNCKSIDLQFEDDEIILIDGAEFTIAVRTTIWDKIESYTFVLRNNEWKLKENVDEENINQ